MNNQKVEDNKDLINDINKLINDYANNHLFYKKYACRYPSIDFYKEKKPKKTFLFHSSDAKKNINKPICKTESNYSPKISDMFSTKYYLNNNINYNFERFPIIKKNRLKKRKKKFKDFDYQDLKKLIEGDSNNIKDKQLEAIKFYIEQSDIKNMLWGKEILKIIERN